MSRARAWFQNKAEPVWEIAALFPPQGKWTEEEYLTLETDRRIELADGCLEFLPMPKVAHKLVELFLFQALLAFVHGRKLGFVSDSGLKVRLWNGLIRLPDIVFVSREHKSDFDEDCYNRADLVMEVVSPSGKDRNRDYFAKRREYAKAGISEYWIVDPALKQIKVLTLNGGKSYKLHGSFSKGQKAASKLLKGFEVDVTDALAGLKQ
jgi:Uma2 family endonuclease